MTGSGGTLLLRRHARPWSPPPPRRSAPTQAERAAVDVAHERHQGPKPWRWPPGARHAGIDTYDPDVTSRDDAIKVVLVGLPEMERFAVQNALLAAIGDDGNWITEGHGHDLWQLDFSLGCGVDVPEVLTRIWDMLASLGVADQAEVDTYHL